VCRELESLPLVCFVSLSPLASVLGKHGGETKMKQRRGQRPTKAQPSALCGTIAFEMRVYNAILRLLLALLVAFGFS
jgi:hypothetical protein